MLYIAPNWGLYMNDLGAIYKHGGLYIDFSIKKKKLHNITPGIYIIYMGFCRAICRYIAASTSEFFFRPRPSASDEKKIPRFRGYIPAYSPPKPHIYITYIL